MELLELASRNVIRQPRPFPEGHGLFTGVVGLEFIEAHVGAPCGVQIPVFE